MVSCNLSAHTSISAPVPSVTTGTTKSSLDRDRKYGTIYPGTQLRISKSITPVNESFLRYTDLAAAIQLARSHGMTTAQIVRALSANMVYSEALILARRAAPVLGIKISEFMQIRRSR